MNTFDLSHYNRNSDDVTMFDVYLSTLTATRRIAAFSTRVDAIDYAAMVADRTSNDATRRVVVVLRDSSGIVASF